MGTIMFQITIHYIDILLYPNIWGIFISHAGFLSRIFLDFSSFFFFFCNFPPIVPIGIAVFQWNGVPWFLLLVLGQSPDILSCESLSTNISGWAFNFMSFSYALTFCSSGSCRGCFVFVFFLLIFGGWRFHPFSWILHRIHGNLPLAYSTNNTLHFKSYNPKYCIKSILYNLTQKPQKNSPKRIARHLPPEWIPKHPNK